ncbi:MAG TPA: hypothetical protein VFS43_01095 [Polyangiaceae bacterium]|nr:hypothetical protein [Polyangiaceae bacterium]
MTAPAPSSNASPQRALGQGVGGEKENFQRYAPDGASVELGPLSAGGFAPTLSVPGDVLGIARIR